MLTCVIPVYENLPYTIGCLSSLYSKSRLVNEVIIIDNSPKKDTARWLLNSGYDCRVYIPGNNLGVSRSWDVGIKMAKNNLVAVINNDTEIITDSWDEVLINQWTKYPNCAVFCPWPVGAVDENLHEDNEPMEGINGSFFVIDKNKLEQTENFVKYKQYIDNNYQKAYWEDADLLVQIRNAKFQGLVTPKVKILHYMNKTAGPMLPSDKGMHNPYWQNLDYFNKKYGVLIWDYFKVYMSNVLDENTNERLI